MGLRPMTAAMLIGEAVLWVQPAIGAAGHGALGHRRVGARPVAGDRDHANLPLRGGGAHLSC